VSAPRDCDRERDGRADQKLLNSAWKAISAPTPLPARWFLFVFRLGRDATITIDGEPLDPTDFFKFDVISPPGDDRLTLAPHRVTLTDVWAPMGKCRGAVVVCCNGLSWLGMQEGWTWEIDADGEVSVDPGQPVGLRRVP
jgi:hypothetical protein